MTNPDIALTAALSAIDSADTDPLIAAKVRGLMYGYHYRWCHAEWETISAEEPWHLPVINPETGAKSKTFTQAGKFDGTIRYKPNGQVYLLEHKTCAEDITDPNATYWRRLTIDSQVSAYALAAMQGGEKFTGTLYDVIRKPDIRPKQIPAGDTRQKHRVGGKLVPLTDAEREENNVGTIEEIRRGTYHGFNLFGSGIDTSALESGQIEPPGLYALRLAAETIANPERYYQRKIITRLDHEIVEYASELWDVSQSIIEARRHDRHYRNSDACMRYGSPCQFLGVCSGYDTIESDRWERVQQRHPELPTLPDGGLSVLTNTRIKAFSACRRLHLYKYELGVRRRDDEDRESLLLGDLMHKALEAWWLSFKEGSVDEFRPADAPAVSEAAGATSQKELGW
jgi:hypothetical protein